MVKIFEKYATRERIHSLVKLYECKFTKMDSMQAAYFVEHIFFQINFFVDHLQWLLLKKWSFLGFSDKKYFSWNYINMQIKVFIFRKFEKKNFSFLFQWETFLIGIYWEFCRTLVTSRIPSLNRKSIFFIKTKCLLSLSSESLKSVHKRSLVL